MRRIGSALGICLLTSLAQAEPPITGRATVIDGDTIDIAGQRIRFNGIDAPESRQTCADKNGYRYNCGKVAAAALDSFLAKSRPTRCQINGLDRYRRFIGDCFRADGLSVAEWMVRNGHALDWPKYSKLAYDDEEDEAQANHAGIWQGKFIPPWDWRKAH